MSGGFCVLKTISPGLSTTLVPSRKETLPVPVLLTAAPPPPAPLPERTELRISTRPPGRNSCIGLEISHSYSTGAPLLIPPPAPWARFFLTWTLSSRRRPDDQFWIAPPSSTEYASWRTTSRKLTLPAV